jgi:RNA polymerase sigma-70 factor (ECF subfamily)
MGSCFDLAAAVNEATFSDANWSSMGGVPGANGPVHATAADDSGNLYFGGTFSIAGEAIANNVAKWNGNSWSALGSGLSGDAYLAVAALAVSGSDLYAGGAFTTAGGKVSAYVARAYLQQLRHQEGKFRSFLLAYLKNFLSEQRRRAGAQKRGGGCVFVSLGAPAGEEGYLLEPVDALTPDQVFERRWAQAILQTALNRLRAEFTARDQAVLFERLQDYQPREAGGRSYAQLGEELGLTEAAVKSAVQRMRQRHRELLREEIAQTVTRPEEIEEELRHFRAVLRQTAG